MSPEVDKAMREAQERYERLADQADNATVRALNLVIADAFRQERDSGWLPERSARLSPSPRPHGAESAQNASGSKHSLLEHGSRSDDGR